MGYYYGTTNNDTLKGSAGSDYIDDGSGGSDVMRGLEGNDNLVSSGGLDTVHGGEGLDELSVRYTYQFEAVTTVAHGFVCGANKVTYDGIERFWISAGSGADSIKTGSGDDTLNGGTGKDSLDAGGGNDVLRLTNGEAHGGKGEDLLIAEFYNSKSGVTTGADGRSFSDGSYTIAFDGIERFQVAGGSGADSIRTGAGNDTIDSAYGGVDSIDSGAGNDRLSIVAGEVDGGRGVDSLFIDFHNSSRDVTTSHDDDGFTDGANYHVTFAGIESLHLVTGQGNDSLRTGAGDDTIYSYAGEDSFDGGAGDDILTLAAGEADGGFGYDKLSVNFSFATEAVVTTRRGFTDHGDNTIVFEHIERLTLTTGSGADSIEGRASDDYINTRDGDDTVSAGDGADTVVDLAGDDVLDGGTGVDTLSFIYYPYPGGATVDLRLTEQDTGYGLDKITGFENLQGTYTSDRLTGDGKANKIEGVGGADTIEGGGGDDVLSGYNGDARLIGGAGDDVLQSSSGADSLYGGSGADTLIGGFGRDRLEGGGQADSFRFGPGGDSTNADPDTIVDLESIDVIDLTAIDADITQDGNQAFTLVDQRHTGAGEAVLTYDAGHHRTLLRLYVDGDKAADQTIVLTGDHTGFDNFAL